jgi:hypothetical protein
MMSASDGTALDIQTATSDIRPELFADPDRRDRADRCGVSHIILVGGIDLIP